MSDENPTVPAKQSKHGLYVRAQRGLQLRDAKVARLKRKLYVIAPWLTEADDPMARRFCELQVLVEQVYAFVRAGAVVNGVGEVKTAVDAHRRLTLAQVHIARELGLTPASRTALNLGSRDVGFITAEVIANVEAIGESRAAERAQRAKETKDDGRHDD